MVPLSESLSSDRRDGVQSSRNCGISVRIGALVEPPQRKRCHNGKGATQRKSCQPHCQPPFMRRRDRQRVDATALGSCDRGDSKRDDASSLIHISHMNLCQNQTAPACCDTACDGCEGVARRCHGRGVQLRKRAGVMPKLYGNPCDCCGAMAEYENMRGAKGAPNVT